MSKVGQIYYQTNGNFSEKIQFAVDTLSQQYAQLKQISQSKQQKIDQLPKQIQELKEQEEENQKISTII